jgi:hypothetical protein
MLHDRAYFLDLPIDLLPLIIRHIVKPSHLALCCLVNSTFSSFVIPQLYERIYIYAWHKHGKAKVGTIVQKHYILHVQFL